MSEDEVNTRSSVTLYWNVWLTFALSYLLFHFFFLDNFVFREDQLKFFVAAYGVPCVLAVMFLNKIESPRFENYIKDYHSDKIKYTSDLIESAFSDVIPHKEEDFAGDPVYQALKANYDRFLVFALVAFSSFIPLGLIIRFAFPYLRNLPI